MNWNVKRFSMWNISQVILMRTDSNLCRKELTVHWSAPNSLIRSYLQPCTNSMWRDESEAVAPIIWLFQIVDAQKEEVLFPELLLTVRSYVVRDNGFHSPGWPISNLLFILLHRLLWVTWWYLQTTKNMMRLLHLKLFLNTNNNELTYFVSLTWVRFLFGLRISSKLLCGDIDFLWAEPCLVSFGGAR